MALAETAMEPRASSARLFCVDPLPESRRFIGSANARWSTFIGWFVRPFEEGNTSAVSGTESGKTHSDPDGCIVYHIMLYL
jgi:hypothetical protein